MRKKIREGISEMLEFPKEVVMDLPKLTMAGNRELYLENYKGIVEYTSAVVRLNLGEKELRITGENLGIRSIESEDITVSGLIGSVEFI